MENSSKDNICCNNARFMQPLLPNFRNSFSIPVAFVARLEEELRVEPLKRVMLTTEDEPHLHWKVEIEGGRHFKDGWKEFSDKHGLKVGDFVVFAYQYDSTFQVYVFDFLTSCQRLHPGSKTKSSKSKSSKSKSGEVIVKSKRRTRETQVQGNPSVGGRFLACQITLSSFAFRKSIVYLSRPFTRSSGLTNTRCEIKLIDEKGRHWKVQLHYRKYDSQSFLGRGWKLLQAANNFKPGDVIFFQLLKNSGRCPTMKCYRLKRRRKS